MFVWTYYYSRIGYSDLLKICNWPDSISCVEDPGAELPELSSSDHHPPKVRQGLNQLCGRSRSWAARALLFWSSSSQSQVRALSAVWKIQELSCQNYLLLIIILLKSGKDSISCVEDTEAELPELSPSDHHPPKVRQGLNQLCGRYRSWAARALLFWSSSSKSQASTLSAVWKIQDLSCQSSPLLIIIHQKSGKDSISYVEDTGAELPELSSSDNHPPKVRQGLNQLCGRYRSWAARALLFWS